VQNNVYVRLIANRITEIRQKWSTKTTEETIVTITRDTSRRKPHYELNWEFRTRNEIKGKGSSCFDQFDGIGSKLALLGLEPIQISRIKVALSRNISRRRLENLFPACVLLEA
jgi:hypothetical protein